MKTINKFNPIWQLNRVEAKKIKNVKDKVNFIIEYYNKYYTISDKARVLNWLNMTKLGYNGIHKKNRIFFEEAYEELKKTNPSKFENNYKIDDLSKDQKKIIIKDLEKRKYNFRMGGKIPKDHIIFVEKLQADINNKED